MVGGVDTLCGSVLFGFNSLELVSPDPCRPFDVERRGINLGEAAGFALLEREGAGRAWLLGYGESSDAHHMSTPHPEGRGARLAMQAALERAQLAPGDIDYINLHGTASQKNDEVEARLVAELFPAQHPRQLHQRLDRPHARRRGHRRSSDQPARARARRDAGHAEFADARSGLRPADPPRQRGAADAPRVSFSFGFGGSNCVLAFGSGAAA